MTTYVGRDGSPYHADGPARGTRVGSIAEALRLRFRQEADGEAEASAARAARRRDADRITYC